MIGKVVAAKVDGIVPYAPDQAGGDGGGQRISRKEAELEIAAPAELFAPEDGGGEDGGQGQLDR